MRLWHVRRACFFVGAVGAFGILYLFLNRLHPDISQFHLLESAHIDKIQRFKEKINIPNRYSRQNTGNNESCVLSNGSIESSLGPKIPLDKLTLQKLQDQVSLPSSPPWPSNLESLFSADAIKEAGLPFFRARIPALVYHKNSFLAFSEARFDGLKDFGNILLVMRRGDVKGRKITWKKIKLLANFPGFRINNPSPIVDSVRDSIVIVFAAFPTELSFEDMMAFPRFPMSKVYVMKSYDLGETWTSPDDVSSQTVLKMLPVPVLFVPGPGHSIQLKCGRIVVPCNYFTQDRRVHISGMCHNCTNYNRIIFSDDGGNTWSVGSRSRFKRDTSRMAIHPNEVMAVEVDRGVVSLNSRTLNFQQPRAVIYSFDGGMSLSETLLKEELIEPGWKMNKQGKAAPRAAGGCQGSLIGFPAPPGATMGHKTWVILSNPADRIERQNLALRLSIDGCQSWSDPFRIHTLRSAYSDITYFESTNSNGTSVPSVAVIFEGGFKGPYEYMRFKVFSLETLLQGLIQNSGVTLR